MNDCGCVNTNLCDHGKIVRPAGSAQLPSVPLAAVTNASDAPRDPSGGAEVPPDDAAPPNASDSRGASVRDSAGTGGASHLALPAIARFLASATDDTDRAARERFIGISRRGGNP